MKNLHEFYDEIKGCKNLFIMSDICKKFKVNILARDTNNTSFIVKFQGVKWYVSSDKIERSY